jgi:hypothetical protein
MKMVRIEVNIKNKMCTENKNETGTYQANHLRGEELSLKS